MSKHSEKCKVCNSEQRKEIERDYVGGLSLREIELEYPEISAMSMCRHVAATPSLRKRRDGKMENIIDRVIDNGALNKERIDGRLLMDAVKTKLKLQGKLDNTSNTKSGDVNVHIQIIQEGKEQLEKNRLQAYKHLRYGVPSDN